MMRNTPSQPTLLQCLMNLVRCMDSNVSARRQFLAYVATWHPRGNIFRHAFWDRPLTSWTSQCSVREGILTRLDWLESLLLRLGADRRFCLLPIQVFCPKNIGTLQEEWEGSLALRDRVRNIHDALRQMVDWRNLRFLAQWFLNAIGRDFVAATPVDMFGWKFPVEALARDLFVTRREAIATFEECCRAASVYGGAVWTNQYRPYAESLEKRITPSSHLFVPPSSDLQELRKERTKRIAEYHGKPSRPARSVLVRS